jgi:hypothetical protein
VALCAKAAPEIIEELKRLATDPNPSVRLAACKELLDRGIGKAAQPVTGPDAAPDPIKIPCHGRYVAFQMAEVAIPRNLFADILQLIAELRPPPFHPQCKALDLSHVPFKPWGRCVFDDDKRDVFWRSVRHRPALTPIHKPRRC